MKRILSLALGISLGCGASAPTPPTSPSASASAEAPRSVLVVSIDGLRDDYLRDTTHAIPTLRSLMASGATAHSMISVWPSVTYPAHATLVTGVAPARHGIVNNVVFDPYEKNDGGWYWYARDLRVETLWDAARRAGIENVANITWPVTVGANIRWNMPQFWRSKNEEDEKLLCVLATPGLCDELRAANLKVPGEHRPDRDRVITAGYLLRTKKPRLTFAYLADLDTVQHEHGPQSPQAWATLERTDALLGYLIAEARAHIPKLAIVIVSDHGFVPVDRDVRPNVALRLAGLLESKDETPTLGKNAKVISYRATTWKAGGSVAIVGDPAVKAQVVSIFTELAAHPETSRIAQVLDGAFVESQGGFPGALVVLQAAPGATFSDRQDEPMVAPSKYKGMHGHAPTLPNMACSLVMAGDGIRAGAQLGDVAMTDVAPTVAALLGMPLPSATGQPIRAALVR